MISGKCCRVTLRTREDVLNHYAQIPFTGDRRNFFGCNKHDMRWSRKCDSCAFARFVNAIDKSLMVRPSATI